MCPSFIFLIKKRPDGAFPSLCSNSVVRGEGEAEHVEQGERREVETFLKLKSR